MGNVAPVTGFPQSLMRRAPISTVILLLALSIVLTGCESKKGTIVGKYRFVGSARTGTLVLRDNGTYQLCPTDMKCGEGTYQLTRMQDAADQIGFTGNAMAVFEYGGLSFKGSDGSVHAVTGGGGIVEYDIWSNPRIEFGDPDSGEYFEKI
jgi:hypothetical protein